MFKLEEAQKLIDENSNKLIDEFHEHFEQVKNQHDEECGCEKLDNSSVFEGWAIQKISALQIVILQLTNDLENIRTRLKTR